MSVKVDLHGFAALRWWDRVSAHGRCVKCYLPKSLHPTRRWSAARPRGDTSPARTGRST